MLRRSIRGPPGSEFIETAYGRGLVVSFQMNPRRFNWRSGYRYISFPTPLLKALVGTSAPEIKLHLTKESARSYAFRYWQTLSSDIQGALCSDCGREPRSLPRTLAADLCFKLLVVLDAIIPADDQAYENGLDAQFDEMMALRPEDELIPE